MSANDAATAPVRAETSRYTVVAIALHWLIALAIVALILVGWNMGDLPDDAPEKEALYQLHKSFGITVLVLTIARIAWRVLNPPPPLPDDMKDWERTLSKVTHYGFYALMLAMPLTGWALVSTAYEFDVATVLFGVVSWPDLPLGFLANETGYAVVEFVHSKLAWVAIGLIVLHVAGALKHEFGPETGVFTRMLPGLFGPVAPPRRAARGGLIAFGGAVAIFLLIAGLPLLSSSSTGNAEATTEPLAAANWKVDPDQSKIAFSGTNNGQPYSGTFEEWTASIVFDPDRLQMSEARVTVDMASAVANQRNYTDTLRQREWFHVSAYPTAEVTLNNFRRTDTGYAAAATLKLKDIAVTKPFHFTLDIDGDTARMQGETSFSRAALDLGMSSDPKGDWVANTVKVDVNVLANRISD